MPRLARDIEIDEIIEDAFDYLWESFDQALLLKLVESIEIPVATEMAMMRLYKIAAWSTCSHDGGPTGEGQVLELFTPDTEPRPVTIDPWARGTVQTKKPAPEVTPFTDHIDFNRPNETPSVGSRMTGRTKSEMGASRAGTGLGGTRKTPGQDDLSHQIWNLDEEPEDFDNLNVTGHMFNMYQKAKRQKQFLPEATVEEKGEFQSLEENIKMVTKDLKGGKYVLDKNGNVIPLHNVKPESLPPFALDITPKVINGVREPPPPKQPANSKSDDSGTTKKKKTVRVAGSRAMDTSFFTAANTLSTALAGGDYITTINPGVVLRVDDKVIEGPPAPVDPSKPTRQQYLDRSMSLQSLNGDSMMSNLRQGSTETFGMKANSLEDNSKLPISMQFPDIDALEGGRKVEQKQETSKVQELLQNSFELSHSTRAGRNISATVVPSKANEKQHSNVVLLTGGPDKIHPRDRNVPMSMVPVSERKRLPAPPLGQSTGHGLSPTKSVSSVSNV